MTEDLKKAAGQYPAAPGLKILLSKMPVRPGSATLALASEEGESKLLFHQRNKEAVAARAHVPYRGYAVSDC
jgi:hypothetical protein